MDLIEALVSSRITKRVLAKAYSRADISIGPLVTPLPLAPRVCRDDRGQDLIEYAVIAAFVALVALVGATTLGSTISSIYHATTHNVDHGASFTSSGSTNTTGGGCGKDGSDSSAGTTASSGTSSATSTGSSGCK